VEEVAGEIGIADLGHDVLHHPAPPADEHQLEPGSLRNTLGEEPPPDAQQQRVVLARLDGAHEHREATALDAVGQRRGACGTCLRQAKPEGDHLEAAVPVVPPAAVVLDVRKHPARVHDDDLGKVEHGAPVSVEALHVGRREELGMREGDDVRADGRKPHAARALHGSEDFHVPVRPIGGRQQHDIVRAEFQRLADSPVLRDEVEPAPGGVVEPDGRRLGGNEEPLQRVVAAP
jgi:hypothetical protein